VSEFADLQAGLESVAADRAERLLKIKRGELIAVASLKPLVVEQAHSTRESLLFAHARHGASLAASYRVNPSFLLTTLDAIMRATLTRIAKEGPTVVRGENTTAEGSDKTT
jgi:hypothetical protein